jgi:adenylosuccinate synthase
MTIHAIVGGQFGSEAKGHVAAQLTKHYTDRGHNQYLVRVGGSNAGHSAVDNDGKVWALRQIPAAAVIDRNARLVIAEGSEIDLEVLFSEIEALDAAGFDVSGRLFIDSMATIIEPHHIEQESSSDINARTGSTSKGIGAARADRLMRKAKTARDITDLNDFILETSVFLQRRYYLDERANIIIEGTQGYGLGLHTEYYPQTTSGNCRTVDLLAQIGFMPLNPNEARDIHTWLVFRTYPIRVAGNSGPLFNETTWQELNALSDGYIKEERTTVTKKVRRVGKWDDMLASEAVRANGGAGNHLHPCLMFVDYLNSELYLETDIKVLYQDRFDSTLNMIERMQQDVGVPFAMYGTSNQTVIWNHDRLSATIRNWDFNYINEA